MPKLLFLQLPIQRLHVRLADENFPTAAYALRAYLLTCPCAQELEIDILPAAIQNIASDSTLLHEIRQRAPDVN